MALAVQSGGDIIFAGQRQRQCPKTGIQRIVPRHRQKCIQQGCFRWTVINDHFHQHVPAQRLTRSPFVERIRVVGQ